MDRSWESLEADIRPLFASKREAMLARKAELSQACGVA